MEKFDVPSKLVRMVKACIKGSRCKIKFGNSYSEEFIATLGLKQGDALLLTLFNIPLEEVVRKVQEIANGINLNGKVHALLTYADDVVILGKKEEDIKNTTKELITRALSMELMINEEKIKYTNKYLVFNYFMSMGSCTSETKNSFS
uniref:Reverse transcriptase domain-containing protein n=1 Tax=Schizaphis graminum TaxID=13262 RepID=A0A2S2PAK1_SCHGA